LTANKTGENMAETKKAGETAHKTTPQGNMGGKSAAPATGSETGKSTSEAKSTEGNMGGSAHPSKGSTGSDSSHHS
jgi:hypothetical protein